MPTASGPDPGTMPERTPDQRPKRKPDARSWAAPALAALGGVAYFVAAWIAGEPGLGAVLLLIMLGAAAVAVLAARYSETVRGLLDHRDERITGIDRSASLFAGTVLLLVVLGAFVVSLAQGHDGDPYGWLAAITGVAYIVAVVYLRFRR